MVWGDKFKCLAFLVLGASCRDYEDPVLHCRKLLLGWKFHEFGYMGHPTSVNEELE